MNNPSHESERSQGDNSSVSDGSSLGRNDGQQQQQQHEEKDDDEQGQGLSQEERRHISQETRAVKELLSREMMQLTLQDRTNIDEEIHGVKCLAPLETPELLQRSLYQLEIELNKILLAPNPGFHNSPANSLLIARRLGNDSYANSIEFKLRFLRCELFNDIPKAAHLLCNYLHRVHTLFGRGALARELDLHEDFTKEELREFRKGYFQLLPYRDRSGRRILIVFPTGRRNLGPKKQELRTRFLCYLTTVAAKADVETQRKGVAILVWFHSSAARNSRISIEPRRHQSAIENYGDWGCVRIAAVHVCSPDTPFYRFRQSMAALDANQKQRSRFKFHVGGTVELLYLLRGFGIPSDMIPVSWSGTVKLSNYKHWMKLRRAIEADAQAEREFLGRRHLHLHKVRGYQSSVSSVVECPNCNDVVFRQGTSLYSHPGNVRFRSLIESTVIEMRRGSNRSSSPKTDKAQPPNQDDDEDDEDTRPPPPTTRIIARVIDIVTRKEQGRFLAWVANHNKQKYGCWCVMTKKDEIYTKVEYAVREHVRERQVAMDHIALKSEKQTSNQQTIESSTSIFRSGGKRSAAAAAAAVAAIDSKQSEKFAIDSKQAETQTQPSNQNQSRQTTAESSSSSSSASPSKPKGHGRGTAPSPKKRAKLSDESSSDSDRSSESSFSSNDGICKLFCAV